MKVLPVALMKRTYSRLAQNRTVKVLLVAPLMKKAGSLLFQNEITKAQLKKACSLLFQNQTMKAQLKKWTCSLLFQSQTLEMLQVDSAKKGFGLVQSQTMIEVSVSEGKIDQTELEQG